MSAGQRNRNQDSRSWRRDARMRPSLLCAVLISILATRPARGGRQLDEQVDASHLAEEPSEARRLYCVECSRSCASASSSWHSNNKNQHHASKVEQEEQEQGGEAEAEADDEPRASRRGWEESDSHPRWPRRDGLHERALFEGALECKCKAAFDLESGQLLCKNMARAQVSSSRRDRAHGLRLGAAAISSARHPQQQGARGHRVGGRRAKSVF